MRSLWTFLWRDIQNELSYGFSFFMQMLSVFPPVLLFFFLTQFIGGAVSDHLQDYGGRYFPFVLIGLAVQGYLSTSLSGLSAAMREAQLSGTFEALLSTPARLPVLIIGSALYPFLLSTIRTAVLLIFGCLLSDAGFHWGRLPSAMLVSALTMVAFFSLGLVSAGFIVLFKKGDPLNWLFNVVPGLLSGVYFPVSVLPPGLLREMSSWIPVTHSVEALRALLLGDQSLLSAQYHVMALFLWASIGLPAGYLWLRFAVSRARRTGALGHY